MTQSQPIFEVSKHASRRMQERGIPDPNKTILKLAKKKARTQIIRQCPKNGYKTFGEGFLYYRTNGNPRFAYVVGYGEGKFTVITAFQLTEETL